MMKLEKVEKLEKLIDSDFTAKEISRIMEIPLTLVLETMRKLSKEDQ